MRRWGLPVLGLLILTACQDQEATGPSELSVAPQASAGVQVIPDEYIVVFKNNVNVADVRGLAQQLSSANGGRIMFVYTAALKGFALNLPAAMVERLRNHPSVDYVQANGLVTISTEQTGATWGIDRIDQQDLPLSTTYNYDATGAGVHAYVIDTGIRITHTEFGGRASHAFDAIGDGQNGNDCHGHGTHVSGTVGGTTWGVAKNVTLHAVRVLNCSGSGSFAQVISGIDWVTANHIKPAVANMSLGGTSDPATNQAVRNSIAAGVTYALAAGNGNIFGVPIDACTQSPAGTVEAITVGATDIIDKEASFSNFGLCVDILAPGVNVTSAWIGSDNATAVLSGTSMASPHVAGSIALYLEKRPTDAPANVADFLTRRSVLNTITLHSKSISGGTPNRFLQAPRRAIRP